MEVLQFIKDTPVLMEQSDNLTLIEGMNANFLCKFQSDLSMVVHWLRPAEHLRNQKTYELVSYRPVHKKYDSSKLKNFINEKFKKIFNFFTCILPNNVAHDITKEF